MTICFKFNFIYFKSFTGLEFYVLHSWTPTAKKTQLHRMSGLRWYFYRPKQGTEKTKDVFKFLIGIGHVIKDVKKDIVNYKPNSLLNLAYKNYTANSKESNAKKHQLP